MRSTRRALFSKTLAWLGAGFVCSKAAAAAEVALATAAPRLDNSLQQAFVLYDAGGRIFMDQPTRDR